MAGDENAKGPERPSGSAGRLAALGAGLVLGAIAYSPLFLPAGEIDPLREAEEWFFLSSSGSEGIVLLLCAWLFYRRWSGLRALPGVSGFRTGPAIFLVLGVCLASWSYLTGAADVLVLSLLANGVGLTLAFRGARGLRFTGFPLAVLVLALPLPGVVFNEVVFQFQLWTAQWAGWLLHHLGFVAFVQSDLIIRPEDTFEIVEGCSGIRSVEALTLLSILVVDSFHRRGLHAVIIVALAPAVAFLMNGFRVLTLIFNPDSDVVAIHNLQGVVILLAGLILMVLVDGLLERLIATKAHSRGEPETEGSAAGGDRSALAALLVTFGACAFASLMLAPAWAPASLPAALRVRLVAGLESWSWTPIKIDQAYLGQTNFRESLEGSFYRDGEVVDVFIGVGDPRKRDRSFVTPKTAFPGSGWVVLQEGRNSISPLGVPVEWRLLRSGTRRVLSYRAYWGVDRFATEALIAFTGLDSSPLRPAARWDGLVARITTPLRGPGTTDLAAARGRLDNFAAELAPTVRALEQSLGGKDFSQFSVQGKKSSFTESRPLK